MCSFLQYNLITIFLVLSESFKVTIYSSTNQSENWKTIHINDCVNLNEHFECVRKSNLSSPFQVSSFKSECNFRMMVADNAESIDTQGNCVRVYRNYDCNDIVGPRIEPGSSCHSNWAASECGFANDIRSISACDKQFVNQINRIKRYMNLCEEHETRNGEPIYVMFMNVGGVKVPTWLETNIYTAFSSRTEFRGSSWAKRFNLMQGVAGVDARGHLLASSLGGKAEDWNFAPQRKEINNGDGSGEGWKSLELRILKHLRKNSCNYVYWHQSIDYSTSPRPDAFTVVADFYETLNKQIVHIERFELMCYNWFEYSDDGFCSTNSTPFPDGKPQV